MKIVFSDGEEGNKEADKVNNEADKQNNKDDDKGADGGGVDKEADSKTNIIPASPSNPVSPAVALDVPKLQDVPGVV